MIFVRAVRKIFGSQKEARLFSICFHDLQFNTQTIKKIYSWQQRKYLVCMLFFLTKQAHQRDIVNELRNLGIDVVDFPDSQRYVSQEKVESFTQNLTDIITSEAGKKGASLYLETTWSPEEGPLRRALKQAALETDDFQHCFPYYTQSSIETSEDWIKIHVRLDSIRVIDPFAYQRPQLQMYIGND